MYLIIKTIITLNLFQIFSKPSCDKTPTFMARLIELCESAHYIIVDFRRTPRHPNPNNCTNSEWSKELSKSLWTPHIQHTPSLNCYRLVDATERWTSEQPDTETVSSLRLSISWTLNIKRGTHNTIIHYLFITNTYFSFQIDC